MLVARLLSWMSSGQKRLAVAALGAALLVALLACAMLKPYAFRFLRAEPYPWANTMSLHSISMVSADDGWAVGVISGSPTTLLMQYRHGQWTILPKPAGLDDHSEIGNVAMVTASDGWALASMPIPIGDRYHSYRPGGVFLHYDGVTWKLASPVLPVAVGWDGPSALLMLSATDGWATAEDKTLHYDGTAWREVTALTDQHLGWGPAISASGPNDVWIESGIAETMLHFDGKTWTSQHIVHAFGEHLPGLIILSGIAMVSPVEGWAVGGLGNSSNGIIVHYVSDQWRVQSIVDQSLYSVAMRSATEGWAVGGSGGIFRYANHQWTKLTSRANYALYDVTTLATGEAWAVGQLGALLHYRNGSWEVETNVVWSKQAQDEWT